MSAYIGGTFDLFHRGHVELLRRAHKKYGYVTVGLNTDEFCERYKRKPVMSYEERFEVLEACVYVSDVIKNHGCEDSKPSILESGANVIIHGDDWKGEALMKQMGLTQEFLDENGIKFDYFPYTGGISTSEIIKRIYEMSAMRDGI